MSTEWGFDGAYRSLSPVGSDPWDPVDLRPKTDGRKLKFVPLLSTFELSARVGSPCCLRGPESGAEVEA